MTEEEIKPIVSDPKKIRLLYDRELKKYKKSNDLKYLMSSKYLERFLYIGEDNNIKQVPLIYELLKLNDSKSEYISISCNFALALQFEQNSPEFGLKFLDDAIKIDERYGKKYFLPHLYHAKGRWFYNAKKYSSAIYYFNKSLQNLNKDDLLYIASMYNNFGMTFNKLGKQGKAIQQTLIGINILKNKAILTNEERFLMNLMIANAGAYYYSLKDYSNAETFLCNAFEFFKDKEEFYRNSITISEQLFSLFGTTKQHRKKEKVINFLLNVESKVNSYPNRIRANSIIQQYYAETNDFRNLKIISAKLFDLNNSYDLKSSRDAGKTADVLNNYMVQDINQKYNFKIHDQERKNRFFLILSLLILIVLILFFRSIKNKNRAEKEHIKNQKEILEQDLLLQRERNKNMRLNLNLKIETEKAFLYNLKRTRMSKNIETEEILKDLYIQINNLIRIDKKNYDFIGESSFENNLFMTNLSKKFPLLSTKELKLCVYFKLNLSSKEISVLEDITEGSVRVFKARINSKVNPDKSGKLFDILNNI
ncbi:hypothetical protein [Chryseobacterium sp. 2987]|uniref:hypothetical protein n=1 Tax=Chryseobacterium sp. 2987 TaxID=2817767 RepID=UPI002860951D|nr:hypothetical protein [Chryseobacterium sp. 2987]MDR6919566.1 hypothetical protein [Chryseobacterium sp. 2987]